MSKHKNDILQIRKYLNGQLDARAMHQLERRALDDPFLADALEGYEHAAADQQANLADLQQRLQSRTDKKVRPMWIPLSAAASLLIIIAAGIWLATKDEPAKKNVLAEAIKPKNEQKQLDNLAPARLTNPSQADTLKPVADEAIVKNKVPVFSAPAIAADKEVNVETEENKAIAVNKRTDTSLFAKKTPAPAEADGYANMQAPTVADIKVNEPNSSLNEVVVQSQKPAAKDKIAASNAGFYKQNAKASPETLLTSRVEGLDIKPSNKSTLTGIITSAGGNTPLVGAIVKIAGSNFGAVTDANGRFVLHDVPEKRSLVVGYLGYDTKKVNVTGIGDSINVALTPAGSVLKQEAISTDKRNRNNAGSASDAHPSAGWKALNDYLDKNAVASDGQTGKVNLSFAVDGQGNLNNFKILKSLSAAADKKAVDLLITGPGWTGNADGQTHDIKLDVVFH
ncbi:carboxypeptidase-like regulatory domain-containing protein [Mucilaginibacter sp.]|uniref:carboxypeptidase-like regulatory domain-containing protein n=1 Tax=Mucilaginibacter sp. TaxID=1882438 RepID=UPI002CBB93A5|nr:carboxypeptidase-like regulatory domain-containing protein [Mucilaginibacter sp.]HTI57596.1 carboxypeptidase-like regulatory domain-containing protein [Mucilaginibacter sp.]